MKENVLRFGQLIGPFFAVAVLVLLFLIPLLIPASARAIDFTSFYCAGQAVATHADPYRASPLGDCERRVSSGWFFHGGVIMPAPLPPYALAAISIVSRLSFPQAALLLDALSIAALIASVLMLSRLTGAGRWLVLFALAPLSWIVVFLGQTILLMLLALVTAAWLVQRDRGGWAALAAAVTMMNPHIGIAICASLFLWRPKTRGVFLGIALATALLSVLIVSWPTSLEYFTSVIALHARSEATSIGQFSTTALLARLGVPVSIALAAGSIQYALTVVAGILLGHRIATRHGEAAALVLIPALFAVVGGTYIHNTDFLLAVPAALMLLRHTVHHAVIGLAIVALAPHAMVIGGWPGAVLGAIAAGVVLFSVRRSSMGAAVVAVLLLLAFFPVAPAPVQVTIDPIPPSAFADESWSRYITLSRASWTDLAVRIPEWIALGTLCILAAGASRKDVDAGKSSGVPDLPQRRREAFVP